MVVFLPKCQCPNGTRELPGVYDDGSRFPTKNQKPKLVKTEILPKNGPFELRTCGPSLTCLFFNVYSSFPLSLISQQQFHLYFYNDSVLICFLIHSSICSFIINLKFIHGGSRKKTKDRAHIKPLIL